MFPPKKLFFTVRENDMDKFHERFIFRTIRQDEGEEAAEIEQICFPPNEACSKERMFQRVQIAPDLFLVAEDRETGKLVGFLNGIATNEKHLRDEFFTDARAHDPDGENVMLFGLAVLPEYRRQGLAGELVRFYSEAEKRRGRKRLVLTCLPEKVSMYEQFGFHDLGESTSVWGGETWHEMEMWL